MRTSELLAYGATPESQPELWRFIQGVADRVGAGLPERVDLVPLPDVRLTGRRLLLGLPQVLGLDADELAEVITQELVVEQARQDWVLPRNGTSGAHEPDQVASALVHSAHLAVAFERFVLRHVGPLAAAGYYPADLWDGWRQVGSQRAPGARPVPLRPLGLEAEAGFALLLAEEFGARADGARLRPVTFDEVPQEVWDATLSRHAIAIRAAAALLLRQPRATAQEVYDMLQAGRGAELLKLAGVESPELDPAWRALVPLLHESLRARLYRFEHPLRQHRYVGPTWAKIDLSELLATLDQPNSQARLTYLLS